MKVFRRLVSTIVLIVGLFLIAMPQIYAQRPIDINKAPIILADKRNIVMARQLLKDAQKSKDPARIQAAKRNLRQAIRKLKADKLLLNKS